MGRTHSWCWSSLPFFYDGLGFKCELAGIAASRQETAELAREAFGFARAYPDASTLIADPQIDVVDIASPNHLHKEAVIQAHRCGKPVYCDKPLTGGLAPALEIERAVPDLDRAGQMVFHNRFFPATLRARRMAESGDLGDVTTFRAEYLHSGNVAATKRIAWKDRRDLGAGVIYDLGSHVVDLLTWIAGSDVVDMYARQRTLHRMRPSAEDASRLAEQTGDDCTFMSVKLANGAVGSIEASKIATGKQDELRFEIHGTRGAIRFNLMDPNFLEWFDQSDPDQPLGGEAGFKRIQCVQRYEPPAVFPTPKCTVGWLRAHLQCLYNFIATVHSGGAFDPSLARGVAVERMLDAAQRSADSGSPVQL
jgi:predicted dehydrogenase